jgi:formylglycine-generating enzyme required for sulfatase activity
MAGCSLLFPFDEYPGSGDGAPGATDQVTVTVPTGTYAIDKFEVTVGDYAAFVAAAPPVDSQSSLCRSWNHSFKPEDAATSDPACPARYANAIANGAMALPVSCVDWCDAVAYCTWAKKRLCGKIGGGPTDAAKLSDATESQWFAACSSPEETKYPYGNDYKPGTCNDENVNPDEVGKYSGCEGGFKGIFDMSGNVAEWEDACSTYPDTTPDQQSCPLRGGAFFNQGQPEFLACAGASLSSLRNSAGNAMGFRCCSDGP